MQKKEQALRTKKLLAGALKEELKHKPLSKIRIRELTDRCEIYRQTFYYHFTDLESLLLWSVQQDIDDAFARKDSLLSWPERIEMLLQYTNEYRGYFLAVLDSNAYPEQRQALQDQIAALLSDALRQENARLLLPAQNYVTIFFSIIEQWIRGTLRQPPEEIVRFFTGLTRESYLSRANASGTPAYLT